MQPKRPNKYCTSCGRQLIPVRHSHRFGPFCGLCGQERWSVYLECPARHEYWGLLGFGHTKYFDKHCCGGCSDAPEPSVSFSETAYWTPHHAD